MECLHCHVLFVRAVQYPILGAHHNLGFDVAPADQAIAGSPRIEDVQSVAGLRDDQQPIGSRAGGSEEFVQKTSREGTWKCCVA